MKKAKKHESSSSCPQTNLFGKWLYKALCTVTKIRKSTKEICQHLSGSSQKPGSSGYKGSTLLTLDEVLETLISPFEVRPYHKVEAVTVKLSMLLALASAGRSSDLRALYVRYMSVKDNSIAFELAQLTESRRKGQSPIKQNFDKFKGDPLLCVFSTITCYLERFGV